MLQTSEPMTESEVARDFAIRVLRQASAESIHQLLSSTEDGNFDGRDPRRNFYAQLVIGHGVNLQDLDDDEVKEAVDKYKSMLQDYRLLPPGGYDPVERFCNNIDRGEMVQTSWRLALLKDWCDLALSEIGA